MFDIKDIMKTDVIVAKRQTGIDEAVKALASNNITGMPVVNNDMTLAGIISERDVLRLLANLTSRSAKVEDFMTENVVSFEQDDDLLEICRCLMRSNFRRVPILSDGKLVGIITRKDITRAIID